MQRLEPYLLPNEVVEKLYMIGGLGAELALTGSRLLMTRKEDRDNGVLSVPYRSIVAVEVSEAKMSFLSAYIKLRIGGEWVRIEMGKVPPPVEVYTEIVRRMG